jgi:hypothetical protein
MNIDEKGKWRTSGEEKKHKTEKWNNKEIIYRTGE